MSGTTVVKKAITPIDIIQNCRGKPVSIELANGETINGTVMRADRAMNVVLKQCIRTAASGDCFWKSRESLVRGASIKNIRMDDSALKARVVSKRERTADRSGGRNVKRPHVEKAKKS